jgi:hypothetical protein
LAAAKVVRQQLLGAIEDGTIPVTATFDADLDGYYVVRSSNVSPVLGVSYESFAFQYSLDLARVGGYSSPVVEMTVSALERDPDPSSASTSIVGYPAAATWWSQLSSSTYTDSRPSETGSVSLQYFQVDSGAPFDLSMQYQVAPADFYDGAAIIEQLVGGTWYPVVGRQLPQISAASIRVGNGMVRASISTGAVIFTPYVQFADSTSSWRVGTARGSLDNVALSGGVRLGTDEVGNYVDPPQSSLPNEGPTMIPIRTPLPNESPHNPIPHGGINTPAVIAPTYAPPIRMSEE